MTNKEFDEEFDLRLKRLLKLYDLTPSKVDEKGVVRGLTASELKLRSTIYWNMVQEGKHQSIRPKKEIMLDILEVEAIKFLFNMEDDEIDLQSSR